MSKDVVWRQMWGAKVQWPCDMPDDLLEDCVTVTVAKLEKMEEEQQDLQTAGVKISQVRRTERLLVHPAPQLPTRCAPPRRAGRFARGALGAVMQSCHTLLTRAALSRGPPTCTGNQEAPRRQVAAALALHHRKELWLLRNSRVEEVCVLLLQGRGHHAFQDMMARAGGWIVKSLLVVDL